MDDDGDLVITFYLRSSGRHPQRVSLHADQGQEVSRAAFERYRLWVENKLPPEVWDFPPDEDFVKAEWDEWDGHHYVRRSDVDRITLRTGDDWLDTEERDSAADAERRREQAQAERDRGW